MGEVLVRVWPPSAWPVREDPFHLVAAQVFTRARILSREVIHQCQRGDGAAAMAICQVVDTHSTHGVYALAYALTDTIIAQTALDMDSWAHAAAFDEATAKGTPPPPRAMVRLAVGPPMFDPDGHGVRLHRAAQFLSSCVTGRPDLAYEQVTAAAHTGRIQLLEGLLQVLAGVLAQPTGGPSDDEPGEDVTQDHIAYLHGAYFTDVSALTDCMADLITAYLLPGLAVAHAQPDGRGGYLLWLQPTGSTLLSADDVREIVTRHGGSYGSYIQAHVSIPPQPVPAATGQATRELAGQVMATVRWLATRAHDALSAPGPASELPATWQAYARACPPSSVWAMMRAHALILDLYTRTAATVAAGTATLAADGRLAGQSARDHAQAHRTEQALAQVVELLARAHGIGAFTAQQQHQAFAALDAADLDPPDGVDWSRDRQRVLDTLDLLGRYITVTVGALADSLRTPDTAEPDTAEPGGELFPFRQVPASQGPARYIGSNSQRAGMGDPGHCEACVSVGHELAHPELGCGDVGCYDSHEPAAR